MSCSSPFCWGCSNGPRMCWLIPIGFIWTLSLHVAGVTIHCFLCNFLPRICMLRLAVFENVDGQYGQTVDHVVVSGCYFPSWPNISCGSLYCCPQCTLFHPVYCSPSCASACPICVSNRIAGLIFWSFCTVLGSLNWSPNDICRLASGMRDL